MTEQQPSRGVAHRPPLRHHWQERTRGKDDRWQECTDCGRKRPVPEPALTFPAPGPL